MIKIQRLIGPIILTCIKGTSFIIHIQIIIGSVIQFQQITFHKSQIQILTYWCYDSKLTEHYHYMIQIQRRYKHYKKVTGPMVQIQRLISTMSPI